MNVLARAAIMVTALCAAGITAGAAKVAVDIIQHPSFHC